MRAEELVEKVTLIGYVKKPGIYRIGDKTTLYDILKAAGGFRKNAYPYGIVILRESVKKMQRQKLLRAILLMRQEIEKEEAGIMQAELSGEEARARQAAFEAKRRLLKEIEKTQVTGRIAGIVVPYDIERLKNSPSNILLESGDRIYIPKKPSSVLVFGEVHNPTAYIHMRNMTFRDYISMAGGMTKDADRENIFVIRADGTAISSKSRASLVSWDGTRKRFIWGTPESKILDYKPRPGDAIIVPTKVHVPVMWRPLIRDMVQILYQSALTVYTISNL